MYTYTYTHPQGVGQRALHKLHREDLPLKAEEGAADVQAEHHAVRPVQEEDLGVGGLIQVKVRWDVDVCITSSRNAHACDRPAWTAPTAPSQTTTP